MWQVTQSGLQGGKPWAILVKADKNGQHILGCNRFSGSWAVTTWANTHTGQVNQPDRMILVADHFPEAMIPLETEANRLHAEADKNPTR